MEYVVMLYYLLFAVNFPRVLKTVTIKKLNINDHLKRHYLQDHKITLKISFKYGISTAEGAIVPLVVEK
jgi:hypothetical protein